MEMEVEKEEGDSKEAEQMPGQLKGPGECDECGQSVKPPLESQYYFQDIRLSPGGGWFR